jgi:transcriptional regulator with XRE-family HTH domain
MPIPMFDIASCVRTRKLCLMTAVQGEPRPSNLEQGWTVDDSTFGARLALVRQRMQWNIKEAARECGIPAASWGTWETGAMPRRYTEMCRLIAERTGCDFGWLALGPAGKDRPAIAHYFGLTDRGSDHLDCPADNRPPGRPLAGAGAGMSRTKYLGRGPGRGRD